MANQIHSEFNDIRFWKKRIQDDSKFNELFGEEKWQAVARWLHVSAHKSIDELLTKLRQFGEATVLTIEPRDKKEHFTNQKAREALEHLEAWIKESQDLPTSIRTLAIQLLANHIAISIKGEEK